MLQGHGDKMQGVVSEVLVPVRRQTLCKEEVAAGARTCQQPKRHAHPLVQAPARCSLPAPSWTGQLERRQPNCVASGTCTQQG